MFVSRTLAVRCDRTCQRRGPMPSQACYLLLLLWLFVGVAIVADVFMSAIERITSEEQKIEMPTPKGSKPKVYYMRIWNPTVANLTLMALGSSAPEILLSVIELLGNNLCGPPPLCRQPWFRRVSDATHQTGSYLQVLGRIGALNHRRLRGF